jgi:RHS repeat-associated protein
VDALNPTGYAQVVEELGTAGVQRTYTYGSQRISQNQIIGSAWIPTFYGYDGAGSVRTLTDTTGTVTDTDDYDAWGNAVSTSGTTPNAYLYQGEQYDSDLGLYYLRARYFNPSTGRFLTTDPDAGAVSDPATLHRYLYATGDPVNRLDPTGRTFMERALQSPVTLTLFVAGAATIIAIEQNIKCIWCKAASQLAAGLFVDMLPVGVEVIGEVAGRTLCTVQVLTTVATQPWTLFRGRGKGERGRTAKPDGTPDPTKHGRWDEARKRWKIKDPNGKWIEKPPGWQPPPEGK